MILVTGSTGFVGRAVVDNLASAGYEVRACSRQENFVFSSGIPAFFCGGLSENTDWQDALQGVSVVIHLAARVHVMNETVTEPLAEFRKVNTAGTLKLARQAAESGIKRFIFVSTIKVNGEATEIGVPFKADDSESPVDPYAISKYEAEQSLLNLAKDTDMEVVIIRPPLVYGVGVRANFESMMKWVSRGIPLPFGAIHNRRSLVAIENLASFIIHCIDHPKAANEIFLISDGEDISTTQLIKKVAKSLGKRPRLVPVPVGVMKFTAKLMGKENVANRLFSSLQVDSSKARDLLGWQPVITMDEQLKKMAEMQRSQEVKRLFDLLLASVAVAVLIVPIIIVAIFVKLTSKGSVLYWSDRVGKDNQLFKMPKFRSMKIDTPSVATHLLTDPKRVLTPIGDFLRKSSLDELPQLWCILRGEMSFVGPRPALFNQHDLIDLRIERGVDKVLPGLTGWAQVNGRDELPIPQKVELDEVYVQRQSFAFDLYILWLTFSKVIKRDGVSH